MMKAKDAYKLTSGSLLPTAVCSRLYNHFKLKQAETGKPQHWPFPLDIERGEYLKEANLTRKFGRVFTDSGASFFCVGISGSHLNAWIEFPGDEETAQGNAKVDKVPLSAFASGKVSLLGEPLKANLSPKRLRHTVSATGAATGLLTWVAHATEFIPVIGEVAAVIGAGATTAASMIAERHCRVGMESEDGRTYLVADMHQTAWFIMDAILNTPPETEFVTTPSGSPVPVTP